MNISSTITMLGRNRTIDIKTISGVGHEKFNGNGLDKDKNRAKQPSQDIVYGTITLGESWAITTLCSVQPYIATDSQQMYRTYFTSVINHTINSNCLIQIEINASGHCMLTFLQEKLTPIL